VSHQERRSLGAHPRSEALPAREVVELHGHIIDSLILAKVLDLILASGGDYYDLEVEVGRSSTDVSTATFEVAMAEEAALEALLEELHVHGVNRMESGDAELVAADRDGVLPEGFYSTTNLATSVRVTGHWLEVENPEMDCALVVDHFGIARTAPMHQIRHGQLVVVGRRGVRVVAPTRARGSASFEFMNSEVSSEKPKALLVAEVGRHLREAKAEGRRVLFVCGPAVIHTGAGPDLERLVRGGFVDLLFAGNGFAAHDIESNVLGTSLGYSLGGGFATEGGHANHLRVINEVRRAGSIAAAVASGYVTSGVMAACIDCGVPFVLAGSLRDDGPLPDVFTDVVAAADAMRALIEGVGVAVMLASTLHSIATGNVLPAAVETYCVDINHAVVTKLADRGSHQALGIVTDVGLFLRDLAEDLVPIAK
jgi:lysine-ketoglutarate reductase/saccharopine dehydrogenase-like protein (TIGR00300 family)